MAAVESTVLVEQADRGAEDVEEGLRPHRRWFRCRLGWPALGHGRLRRRLYPGREPGREHGSSHAIGGNGRRQRCHTPRLAENGTTVLYTVIPTSSPDDAATETLVHDLRETVLPDAVSHVGGATATSIDLADTLLAQIGWFVLIVVVLAFIVLLIEFRAPFIAAMAVIMNLFAVGAAYGPVVAVFQWGWWPAGLLGVSSGPVESFVPVMLFAVLFGLSTDYTVFLLSRVKEELARTGDPDRAVQNGLAATARVILAAASVMVVVFGSFILNDQRTVTMFGFGLAMSVAVYALVVMLVLVPALLAIAGRGAWGRTKRHLSAESESSPDLEPLLATLGRG
ncbi:MMPL family transporter [Cryobacterium sp. Hh11]|uniref:MMPL family transporter n=1 Tax=Cryobacterium sp. Hh11 TaxID=2555868 RepID=UPI0024117FD5|nr:MMPL family transporter [Cryobacterium sp. Hh11]